jgi:ribosomal protein L16 Arg81 hydroxylase
MIKIFKNYNKKVPNWESLLNNFNNSVINNKLIKHKCLGFFVSHEANQIKEVKNILKKLKLKTAHLYFNITKIGGTFGRHKDDVDVYFWQVQGYTKWVFDNKKIILKKGDLLFVPKGIFHEVVVYGPRAGISMSFE